MCTSEYNIGLIPGIAQALEDCLLLVNPEDEWLQLCQALSPDTWPRSLEELLITYLRRIATSSTSPLLAWPNAEEIVLSLPCPHLFPHSLACLPTVLCPHENSHWFFICNMSHWLPSALHLSPLNPLLLLDLPSLLWMTSLGFQSPSLTNSGSPSVAACACKLLHILSVAKLWYPLICIIHSYVFSLSLTNPD